MLYAWQVLGLGGATPKFGEGVGLGVENGSIRKFNVGFLLAPHSDQSAISQNAATLQTDRQTDRIGIAIADLMLRAAR